MSGRGISRDTAIPGYFSEAVLKNTKLEYYYEYYLLALLRSTAVVLNLVLVLVTFHGIRIHVLVSKI